MMNNNPAGLNGEPIWREIEGWIDANPGTGSATALEKLVLSLWSRNYPYSMYAIFHPMDDTRTQWVVDAVTAYRERGERDPAFMRLAETLSSRYQALDEARPEAGWQTGHHDEIS